MQRGENIRKKKNQGARAEYQLPPIWFSTLILSQDFTLTPYQVWIRCEQLTTSGEALCPLLSRERVIR
jgi:hypothetical protein